MFSFDPIPIQAIFQPLATAIAATAAVLGVVWTIRHNESRLRTEQLEKRAKERERLLQEAYADFTAGIFMMSNLRVRYDMYRTLVATHQHHKEPENVELVKALTAKMDTANDALLNRETELMKHFARIRLIDDDAHRIEGARNLILMTNNTAPDTPVEERLKASQASTDFVEFVAVSLESQYKADLERAKEGLHPKDRRQMAR